MRPLPGRRPAACRCSTCGARARAGSRPCSCSAWRRAACPRGARENPFLAADEAAALRRRAGSTRCERDRHLFYTAVTRPWQQLFLCRQAADEDGVLLEPSPFLDEVARGAGRRRRRRRRRRALGDLTWPLDEAPTERERLRALARELRERPDWAMARGRTRQGWARKLERARDAYRRRTPCATAPC